MGLWEDKPEPVSNTVTVTLPRALKEPQDEMWFVKETYYTVVKRMDEIYNTLGY